MNIAFVCWGEKSLGIEYISACLKKVGHNVHLILYPSLMESFSKGKWGSGDKGITRIIENSSFDLLCFSVVSDTYGWALRIAKAIKRKKNLPIVFGGVHPSAVPELVIKEEAIDYVCVGEGEEAVVELVNLLEKKENTWNIKNIWSKGKGKIIKNPLRPLLKNLDSLPFPDKDLFYKEYQGFAQQPYWTITGRGCPCSCTFCFNEHWKQLYREKNNYLRRRSVNYVIEELIQAKEKYDIKNVLFLDSIFTYDPLWLKNFCQIYQKHIQLPFMCDVYAPYVSEEIVQSLEDAGCAAASLGIQTIGETLRKNILSRYDTNQEIIQAITLFKKSKIFLYAHIMFDLPEQNDQELVNTARFLNQNRPDMIFPFRLRYYPQTAIIQIAKEKNILNKEELKTIQDSKEYTPLQIKSNKPIDKIINFILISNILPQTLFNFIMGKKLYLYSSATSSILFHPYRICLTLYKNLLRRKRQFPYLNIWKQLKFTGHYFLKLYKASRH